MGRGGKNANAEQSERKKNSTESNGKKKPNLSLTTGVKELPTTGEKRRIWITSVT